MAFKPQLSTIVEAAAWPLLCAGPWQTKNPPGANREGVLRFNGYFFIA
jgi:hypothetical protein